MRKERRNQRHTSSAGDDRAPKQQHKPEEDHNDPEVAERDAHGDAGKGADHGQHA